MRDEDYGYLARRHVVEQNLALTAKCCASAAAHRGLANAYLVRLQSLILSPNKYRSEMSWASREDWVLVETAKRRQNSSLTMRIPHIVKG